jgi:hypothetical protein
MDFAETISAIGERIEHSRMNAWWASDNPRLDYHSRRFRDAMHAASGFAGNVAAPRGVQKRYERDSRSI